VGFVPQEGALFPHLSVRSNIAFGLARKERAGPRVSELIDLLDLGGLEQRLPHELSGGQQQRVALARALAPTPELILLDEPFSSLDASLRDRLRQEVRDILARAGVTTLFVTHDQAEALSIAETVAVMGDGIVEQAGTPEEIYSRPSSRWVADFLGEVEIVDGAAEAGRVTCELGSFNHELPDGPVEVLIRPESIAIGITGPERAPQGEIVGRRFFGHDQLVELRLPSGQTVRSRRLGFPAWHAGDKVRVWIDGPTDVLPRDES
jgi:iron(III) transport system ATP-binding protein